MYFPSPILYCPDQEDFKPYIAHPGEDVGFDLKASSFYTLPPGVTAVIETRVKVFMPTLEPPFMYELQIRSRSGLAKRGIFCTNQPGTIDPGYKDWIKVLLTNNGHETFSIDEGDRIAQGVFNVVYDPSRVRVIHDLTSFETARDACYDSRGEGGLGSSGIN